MSPGQTRTILRVSRVLRVPGDRVGRRKSAGRDERRLLNPLRADLIATFPAALAIVRDDLGAPTMLRLLEHWPTAAELRVAGRAELVAFAREAHHGWPERFAGRVAGALATEQFDARDYLVRAKAATIRLAAGQLLLLGAQRRAWERRMSELLLGAPRTGRAREPHADRGEQFPGGEIYLSCPGLGDRLAARVAGEIGDHPEMFASPNELQCYAGKAQVTRRSGKSELVVSTRLAWYGHLRDAAQQWAFCSLFYSDWAREFYDGQVAKGKNHHAASGRSATAGSRSSGTA